VRQWRDGYCKRHHQHQIYCRGPPPPPDQPHWIRRYVADKEKQEIERQRNGLAPFFHRIQSSTFENIEIAGPEYIDTIRATLDEATAEAILKWSRASSWSGPSRAGCSPCSVAIASPPMRLHSSWTATTNAHRRTLGWWLRGPSNTMRKCP
jgi:hypothetical protein